MTVRIVTPQEYLLLTNTASRYRDPRQAAKLATKPLEVLQEHHKRLEVYDKQPGEVMVFELPPEVKDMIRQRLEPNGDQDNPEAIQRFAGSWYFAAYRDLRQALYSEIVTKQGVLF